MQAPPEYAPPKAPIDVVFQDESLIVVNKPAGLLSVPGKSVHMADCMASRLRSAFRDTHLVHRLDMDTSGLMVFARKKSVQRDLNAQFENRTVRKTYIALVSGLVSEDTGTVDLPLSVDWPNRPLQKVDDAGKPSCTQWTVRVRDENYTRIELRPETGRTHQLRVHMHAIGHPILGDRFYADGPTLAAYHRLCLHAEKLAFCHPIQDRFVTFESKADF
ncbi:MAG: RluA family pseudouridine synthase [Pseudomonadota bacterium]